MNPVSRPTAKKALPTDDTPVASPERRVWLQRASGVATAALAGAAMPPGAAQSVAATSAAVSRASGAATFCKTFPHDKKGNVAAADLDLFEAATRNARVADWEQLPINNEIRLVNPLVAYAWEKEPIAADVPGLPPFPALDSERLAEEALELYWMALLRDVQLWDYDRASLVRDAVAELRRTKTFASVTPQTLFRLGTPGEGDGYWISQFLWMPVPYGAQNQWQQYRVAFRGVDFMTTWDDYLKVANGEWPPGIQNHYADLYYLRSGRDVAEYVHWDFCNQAAINTAAILLANPHRPREAWPASNPYKSSRSMNGFVQFGAGYAQNAMGVVCDLALKAAWAEKWLRHRALRPEEYGALVDRASRGEAVGIHPLIVNSEAVKRVKARYGSALLPQAYPEGSPAHPAYPSGHAAIAGACVTVLKALFDESRKLRFPLQPTRDGKDWGSFDPNLPAPTVGSELNKLATNVAMGRNFAGIHWRSDAWHGLQLGEHVARAWLKAEKAKSLEGQQGWLKSFEFTNFAGQRVTV